jgi:retron-type reverse transcriptase
MVYLKGIHNLFFICVEMIKLIVTKPLLVYPAISSFSYGFRVKYDLQ